VAAREMIERFHEREGRQPQTLTADTSYGNGELLHWLEERGITPYIRVKENTQRNHDLYGIEKFTYDAAANRYICPEGKTLTYVGVNELNRTHVYASTPKRCRDCLQKAQCTRGRCRFVNVHIHEPARQRAQELAKTLEFVQAQRARRKVEALFAELKNQIGLRRLRLRRLRFIREQFYLAATVQNLRRLVRFLSSRAAPEMATA
jgi:hypothetical protein